MASTKKTNRVKENEAEITFTLMISDPQKRVNYISDKMIEAGDDVYFDAIWQRHFKHRDMFRKRKRPVDPDTGEYFGNIFY